MYDLIGDIHGHADELERLLAVLGYRESSGTYRHPQRRAIFLGDFIDRGPKIRQVLDIVRSMIEEGHALAVMGNHELNALAYHTEDPDFPGEHLRPRTSKNVRQHQRTIEQLSATELESYLNWLRTLPLWLDLDGIRAVHACWDERQMAVIDQAHERHNGITTEFLCSACRKGNRLFDSVQIVLKGREAKLPPNVGFDDKDGQFRAHFRTRWYLPPDGHTYRTYALQSDEIACDVRLDEAIIAEAVPYPPRACPVFFGHYWLSDQQPQALAHNVACLDYSVAKGGFLCAYRWHGEEKLNNDHFVRVK
jgi:hypothetical protein